MMMKMEMERTIECLKKRCKNVELQIQGLPNTKIAQSCKDRLLKLVQAELKFLSRLDLQSIPPGPISTNIGYVESIVYVVQHPVVNGVSFVCKTIQGPLLERSVNAELKATHVDIVSTLNRKPVWFVVSDRNPRYVSWSDKSNRKGLKTRLHLLLEAALATVILQPISIFLCFANGIEGTIAQSLKEEFGAVEHGYFGIQNKTAECLGAKGTYSQSDIFQDVEGGEWVNIIGTKEVCIDSARNIYGHNCDVTTHRNQGWATFEINISSFQRTIKSVQSETNLESKYIHCQPGRVNSGEKLSREHIDSLENRNMVQFGGNLSVQAIGCLEECSLPLDKTFCSVITAMHLPSDNLLNDREKENLINLDTTALVALVSEISNGSAKKLVEMSDQDMNRHFKSTSNFMREQAKSELEKPLLEDMVTVLAGKTAMISKVVYNEFKDLISMCSGPNERQRAECLLKCILVLPNNPSVRVMGLPETGKIKLKHKVIFGTGDYWHAPTLTANMGFVRAVTQTGMSLSVLEHRPRALTGD
eukprot:Gb_00254 [translate_table: standard]